MTSTDKINILVVDDLPEKLLVLESILGELGENIITARSGAEALQQVLHHDFAVILLDVNMPGMDGYETADFIRRRKKSARTPIIFITAFADEVHKYQGYSLGAVDYILSPVVPEILRTKVRVFVELFRMAQEVQRLADERVALAAEQAARAAAEEATRRSAFLAEASKALASSLELGETARTLARLPVPFLADVGAVTRAGEPGLPWTTELAWIDPADRTVQTLTLTAPEGPDDELRAAVDRVLETGRAAELDGLDIPYPRRAAAPAAAPRLRSALVLPLAARGRILGALSLAAGPSGRRFGPADRALAEEFAGRAAICLDNARLYREVQEADHRKNEFLSMLAHELRNPLAPIRNAIQIMRVQGQENVQLQWARDMVDRNVHQLVRLVDDLLDVSRITRGKIRLQVEPVDMAAVVAHAVELSRPLIDDRKHKLSVKLPEGPVRVNGDGTRLAQVVSNLLNNAAKYTDEGGQIWLTLDRDGDDVLLAVRDTGVGIPVEMLSSIFDLFTQVDRSLDRAQGGLGIGLTLVRRIVEMHGGSVRAFSEGPNRGSEFVVRLPVVLDVTAARPADPGRAEAVVNGGPCRVLVVDDNADAADTLALLLRLEGHEVKLAHDGLAALEAAEAFRPDVIFLDIGLPRLDGYEVARRLRERPQFAGVLLVALTGYGQEEDRRRSKECGIDQHLVKPVDPEAVTGLLAAHRAPAAVAGRGLLGVSRN